MKTASMFTIILLSISACDEPDGIHNYSGVPLGDFAGCEKLEAFRPNNYDGSPSWWAIDFSACGSAPEPRLISWESGTGGICEVEYQPAGYPCEIVEVECGDAIDTWSFSMWAMGDSSSSLGFNEVADDQEYEYDSDSSLICKRISTDGVMSWDCTGLPEQPASCNPVTAG